MSFRIHRALIFCILMATSLLLAYTPQAAAATISIPVSIKGLPPEMQTTITVDGQQQGTISGGGTRSFKVDKKKAHIFQVDAEIKGACSSYEGRAICSRYKCPSNVWNLDVIQTQTCQNVWVCYPYYLCDWWGCWWDYGWCGYETQCWTTTELAEKGHQFEYFAEHQVAIADIHGQNVDKWVTQDADLNISAEESVVIRDESDVKERDIFKNWIVNGAPMGGRTLTLKIDKPYYIRAEYRTETAYRVRASSEYGNPTMDNMKGWYMKGDEATVSVEKEVPMDGLWGGLGGKRIFVAWRSPQGVESREPTFTFSVQEPTDLRAEWRTDNSQPMTIIAALIAIIVVLLVIFALYRTGRLLRPVKAKPEPTELEKAKVEIESLKKELEETKKTIAKKKKPPPAEE